MEIATNTCNKGQNGRRILEEFVKMHKIKFCIYLYLCTLF